MCTTRALETITPNISEMDEKINTNDDDKAKVIIVTERTSVTVEKVLRSNTIVTLSKDQASSILNKNYPIGGTIKIFLTFGVLVTKVLGERELISATRLGDEISLLTSHSIRNETVIIGFRDSRNIYQLMQTKYKIKFNGNLLYEFVQEFYPYIDLLWDVIQSLTKSSKNVDFTVKFVSFKVGAKYFYLRHKTVGERSHDVQIDLIQKLIGHKGFISFCELLKISKLPLCFIISKILHLQREGVWSLWLHTGENCGSVNIRIPNNINLQRLNYFNIPLC